MIQGVFGDKVTTLANQNTPEKTLKQRLISGVIWNLVAMAASRGAALAAMIIVARILGKSEYGELGIIQSTIGMFGTFAGMGLGVTSTRYIAELRVTDSNRVGRIIALTHSVGWITSGLLALLLYIAAPWLASETLSNPGLTHGLRWATLLLLFTTVTGVQSGTLAGFEAFKELARIGIIQGVFSFPVILAGVYFGGLEGAVIAMGMCQFLGYLLNLRAVTLFTRQASIHPCYRAAWQEMAVLKQTAIPSMLTGVMVGPIVWWGNTLIVNEPGGYAQLGTFNAVNQWKIMLTFVPAIVGRVLLPMLSNTSSSKSHRLEAFNLLGNWFMVTSIALVLMVFPEIISILYGSEFAGKEFNHSLALMMMVCIILAFKEGIARKLIVGNLLWWGMLSNLIWAVFFIGGVYLFKSKGASGLAFAYVLSYTINTIVFIPFYLNRKVVSRELLLSPRVMLSWSSLVAVLSIVFLIDGFLVRLCTMLSAYVMLWLTIKKFLNIRLGQSV